MLNKRETMLATPVYMKKERFPYLGRINPKFSFEKFGLKKEPRVASGLIFIQVNNLYIFCISGCLFV
jgi:hypothetical protein